MTAAPFEIKVVYDASRKRRGAVVRLAHARSDRRPVTLALGALLNLAVAGTMYYVIWWQVDPFVYLTFMKRVPMDVPQEFAANPFGITATSIQPGLDEPMDKPPPDPHESPGTSLRWTGKKAQVMIPATAYGWLVLATVGACAVALTGGTWLGTAAGNWVRVLGFFGMIALLGGVGYFGYKIWDQYEMMFKPNQLRLGMGWLTLLLALLGLALAGRVRGVTRFAGIVVVIAAIGTATGVWLWTQSGALDPKYAGWPYLAAALAIHAAWGLVLLFSASRIKP